MRLGMAVAAAPPILAGFPVLLHAAEQAPASSPVGGFAMFQVVLALLLVLAAVFLVFWLLRRLLPMSSGADGFLKVLGGVMVGPRERVVVVEVGETWLILGVAAGRVSILHTVSRPPDAQTPMHAPAPEFARWLNRALGKSKAKV
jgi:flagellar protein FliO/FliZ